MRTPTVSRRCLVLLRASLKAGQTLESALGSVGDAAKAALDALTKLSPETLEVEFGIKLAGEAGAIDREDER